MVEVPAETLVIIPPELMVPTAVLLLVHVPPVIGLARASVLPVHTLVPPVMLLVGLTVAVAVVRQPLATL